MVDFIKGIALYWVSILTYFAMILTGLTGLTIDALLVYLVWGAFMSNIFVGVMAFLALGFVITAITFLTLLAAIALAEKAEDLWDSAGWFV